MDGTSNLAFRVRAGRPDLAGFFTRPWLPPESPLAMPRQSLVDAPMPSARPSTSPGTIGLRRLVLFAATIVLAGVATWTPWNLYAADGVSPLEAAALGLFGILILAISCWFCSAVAGFVVLSVACVTRVFPTDHAGLLSGIGAGSWSAVVAHLDKTEGNSIGPETTVLPLDSKGNLVFAPGKRVALIGVEGLAIVESENEILICRLDRDQDVKKIATKAP